MRSQWRLTLQHSRRAAPRDHCEAIEGTRLLPDQPAGPYPKERHVPKGEGAKRPKRECDVRRRWGRWWPKQGIRIDVQPAALRQLVDGINLDYIVREKLTSRPTTKTNL